MSRYDAVLLDAFGTLFELDDPFERLRSRCGRSSRWTRSRRRRARVPG